MLWKMFHWAFGWDYVSVTYGFDDCIRRVRRDGDGRAYVRVWSDLIYLDRPRYGKFVPLTAPSAELGIIKEMLP